MKVKTVQFAKEKAPTESENTLRGEYCRYKSRDMHSEIRKEIQKQSTR